MAEAGQVLANHDNPALVRRYRELLVEGDQAQLGRGIRQRADDAPACVVTEAEIWLSIQHSSEAVRYRRAIELLMAHCKADAGLLCLTRNQQPERVARAGDAENATGLDEFALSVASAVAELSALATATDFGLDDSNASWAGPESPKDAGAFQPVRLVDSSGRSVGVAILRPAEGSLRSNGEEFLSSLANVLADNATTAPVILEPA